MSFTENEKLKALAIVNIFETSRPLGDYAACVVLDDGAGISYGISQFTHRSGSLAAVVEKYLDNGGQVGKAVLKEALPKLHRISAAAIKRMAADAVLQNALRAAAVTREMKEAQRHVAFEKYLEPALRVCEAREFVLPLSLAVIYDSINHGSFEWISARVTPLGVVRAAVKDAVLAEMKWVTEYVRVRDRWLRQVKRLNATRYRTKFFLDQIAVGNWQLRLPVTVHGFWLTENILMQEAEPVTTLPEVKADEGILSAAGSAISAAAEKYDRVETAVTNIVTRTDSAKSLWTTVVGTVSQAAWAIFGVVAGMPREVWFGVAMIAALLMLAYLYRQIELGKIRERVSNAE